jgi:hypothetical protein
VFKITDQAGIISLINYRHEPKPRDQAIQDKTTLSLGMSHHSHPQDYCRAFH